MITYEELLVSADAGVVSLTPSVYDGARRAILTTEGGNAVRFTLDGVTDPTETIGVALGPGDVLRLTSREEIANARFHIVPIPDPVWWQVWATAPENSAFLKVTYEVAEFNRVDNGPGFRRE